MRKIQIWLSATAILFALSACNENANESPIPTTEIPEFSVKSVQTTFVPTDSLSTDEQAGLYLMREEELVARDLYAAFYADFNLPIFNRISESEDRHTTAILALIDFYQLLDPATGIAGEYNNADLQTLYNDLYADGSVGLVEALTVGALVEEVDILDLEELMLATTNENLLIVYDNLLNGSKNHLKAFAKQLANNGVTYVPVVLDQLAYDEILSTPHHTSTPDCLGLGDGTPNGPGNGNGQGYGPGNGQGNGQGNGPGNGMGNGPGHGNGDGVCDSTAVAGS